MADENINPYDERNEGITETETPVAPVAPEQPVAPAPVDPFLELLSRVEPDKRAALAAAYYATPAAPEQPAPAPAPVEKTSAEVELEKAKARHEEISAMISKAQAEGQDPYTLYPNEVNEMYSLGYRIDMLPAVIEAQKEAIATRRQLDSFQQTRFLDTIPTQVDRWMGELPAHIQAIPDKEFVKSYLVGAAQEVVRQGQGDVLTNPNRSAEFQTYAATILYNLQVEWHKHQSGQQQQQPAPNQQSPTQYAPGFTPPPPRAPSQPQQAAPKTGPWVEYGLTEAEYNAIPTGTEGSLDF